MRSNELEIGTESYLDRKTATASERQTGPLLNEMNVYDSSFAYK